MVADNAWQWLTDATGLIIDRTAASEQVLGQACLSSKTRMIACASSVFNYAEAPWALSVKFPYPDLTFAVKTINLHPDFDKREARLNYLANSESFLLQENDLCTLTIEPELQEISPDRLSELNSVLSLQLSMTSEDLSGAMGTGDLPNVLQNIFMTGKTGLLTLVDNRNRPQARLSISNGSIHKVLYKSLSAEFAFFELIYRQPPGGFVFQTQGQFTWPNIRDLSNVPADKLLAEAIRRAQELPGRLSYLGGAETRFQKSCPKINPTACSQALQWIAERLDTTLDGYITLDKLWQRVGADTYSVVLTLQELLNTQQCTNTPGSPFHGSGQLSPPPATASEAFVWDALHGFYLDPLSGRAQVVNGNFFGITRVMQPKAILHTVAIPSYISGAVLLKEDKILALNSGAYQPAAGQPTPPVPVYQAVYIGALQDLGGKRLKDASISMTMDNIPQATPQQKAKTTAFSSSRLKQMSNLDYEQDEMDSDEEPPAGIVLFGKYALPEFIEKKHLFIGGGALAMILLLVIMMAMPKSAPTTATAPGPVPTAQPQASSGISAAADIALKYAGFKSEIPALYEMEDTSEISKPTLSFGINSEKQNQKLHFIVWDNASPVDNLELVKPKPPYTDYTPASESSGYNVDKGQAIIHGQPFNWFVGRYMLKDKPKVVFIGAFHALPPGKAIVVVGTSKNDSESYNYKTALWLIDSLVGVGQTNAASNDAVTGESTDKPLATAAELNEYAQKIAVLIKLKYTPSAELAKAKVGVNIVLNDQGEVTKIEISEPSGQESADQALAKAITSGQPYIAPPHTADGTVALHVTAAGGKLEAALR